MARWLLRGGAFVLALATLWPFLFNGAPAPGVGLLLRVMGGGGAMRSPLATVDLDKLLRDLNADVQLVQRQGQLQQQHQQARQAGGGDAGPAGGGISAEEVLTARRRCALAALSVAHLAAVPELRQQLDRGAAGLEAALLRHLQEANLEVEERLLQQHMQRQARLQQLLVLQQHGALSGPQHDQLLQLQHQVRAGQESDMLSASLLALANLVGGRADAAARALSARVEVQGAGSGLSMEGSHAAAGKGARALASAPLLHRLGQILASGVPTWQAGAAMLLYALQQPQQQRPDGSAAGGMPLEDGAPSTLDALDAAQHVSSWVAAHVRSVVPVGAELVSTGAVLSSPSAVQSGCQLLELAAATSASGSSNGDLEAALDASGVARLLLQVIVTHAGVDGTTDGSSGDGGLGNAVGGQAMSHDDRSLVVGAAAKALSGLIAAARQADKAGAAASVFLQAGALAPLVREVRLGRSHSLEPSLGLLAAVTTAAGGEPQEGAVQEAVAGSGVLSLCAQLLFAGAAQELSDRAIQQLRSKQHCGVVLRHSAQLCDREDSSPENRPEEYQEAQDWPGLVGASLVTIIRCTPRPQVLAAALEACRDAATSASAAHALVGAGVASVVAGVLAVNVTEELGKGADPGPLSWVLRAQGDGAALLALSALQPHLRQQLVQQGALRGLAALLHSTSAQQGLAAQVRVTAAAALVPLLGPDGAYDEEAMAQEVLEPLVRMYYSVTEYDRRAAVRVLALLKRLPVVADLFSRNGINV